MAKRKPLYDRDLYDEVNNLKELSSRLNLVLGLVYYVTGLIEAIENDHPDIKAVAKVVKEQLRHAQDAIAEKQPAP